MPTIESEEPERLFERLTSLYSSDPTVTAGTGFGSSPGLRVRGKIFAMLYKGQLVVKLPRERVDQLLASGTGVRFDPGHGRAMKEWVSVSPARGSDWKQLADDAFAFVGRLG